MGCSGYLTEFLYKRDSYQDCNVRRNTKSDTMGAPATEFSLGRKQSDCDAEMQVHHCWNSKHLFFPKLKYHEMMWLHIRDAVTNLTARPICLS